MATVASTLKMFDAMSGPLRNITQGMNIMISTMRQMQSVTNQNVAVDKSLIAAQERIAAAEAEINRQINQAKQSHDSFNRSARQGESAIRSTGAAVIVLNQGLELLKKGWGAIQSVMGLADEMTATNARLSLVNDKMRSQQQLQQQVLDVSNRTRQSYTATADLVTKLGAGTQGIFKNDDQILAFAERFNKSLVISGATATESQIAILQMSQALGSGRLQGDELRSLSETAPALMRILSDGLKVSRGELKQMGADGKLTADKIVQAFQNQSTQIDTMFTQMPMTFGGAMTILQNTAKTWFGTLSEANGPLTKITAQVQRLTAYLQSAGGQAFLNGLANGIVVAVSWFVKMLETAAAVYNFFSSNWSTLGPIVLGVVTTLGSLYAILKLVAIGQAIVNAVTNANPFILIITIILGLIVYLVRLWQTNDQFAAGLMRAWNTVLNFFDRVPIFFQIVGNGIVDAFQWAKVQSLQLMEDLINGVVDRINGLIAKLNSTGLVTLNAIGRVEFTAKAAAEAEAIKQAGADKIAKMQDAVAVKAAEREQKVLDMLDTRAAKRAEEDAKKAPGNYTGTTMFSPDINKVNEVGKINGTVDISSEDLKTMRDLAEMKNIQNFVSLTPIVQVTGDNHFNQGYDIETIIDRITVSMEEHIAASAQGVYDS